MTLTVGIDTPLDAALYGGGAAATQNVPGRFEVAINGVGFMVDHAADLNGFRNMHFSRQSTPALRAQADTANTPGEQSLNREDLWRRATESWHKGAGQTYLDRSDSDSARFSASKGVDVWTRWQLSLLPDVTQSRASANTNLRLTVAGSYTYLGDGNGLLFSNNLGAWTAVTGTPAASCGWVTTDGNNVYAAYGASGIYSTTRGAATASSFNTLACTHVSYVKGRLMAANANVIYNVTASGAAPAALFTHPNTDFTWVGFAEGPGFIFAAGYSGTRSLIYKITIQPDGTALAIPVVAGELPTGETVRTIKGYLGLLLVGTDTGIRVASIDSAGNLTFGSQIPTLSAVQNFEPSDRFVYYGLTNYDSVSTGLGRIDLTQFISPLTPAYASDLMATGQGAVLSVCTPVAGSRMFAVSGLGVYVQSASKVVSGTLTSGRITHGVADEKVAMFTDLRTAPLAGTVSVSLAVDGGTPVALTPVFNTAGATRPTSPIPALQTRGEFFENTLTLTRSGTDTTAGPTVTRLVLRAYPAPTRGMQWIVPVLLHTRMKDSNGADYAEDPLLQRQYAESLLRSQQLIAFQEASVSYTVLIDDLKWVPIKRTGDAANKSYDGTLVFYMKELSS
jgi:hypothetical protein